MIGHPQRLGAGRVGQATVGHDVRHHLGHVPRDRRDPRGILRQRPVGKKVAVILDSRAAARGVDDQRVQPFAVHLGRQRADVGGGHGVAFGRAAHVVGQRAAAADASGDHDLAAVAAQQADGRVVDVGVERPLRAARQQRHPAAALPVRRENLREVVGAARGQSRRRHVQHRPQPRVGNHPPERPGDPRRPQRQPEPSRIGQHPRQQPAQGAVIPAAAVIVVDVFARVIDQVHVVHARRAGRHAAETAEAAVDVQDRPRIGDAAVFQHVLDEVDAPARAVELVAQHLVGRAGRGAEAAMDAGPQDLVRAAGERVGKLRVGEGRLHVSPPSGRD